eukprot:107761-Chlamydomonas_euryale.AAC.7
MCPGHPENHVRLPTPPTLHTCIDSCCCFPSEPSGTSSTRSSVTTRRRCRPSTSPVSTLYRRPLPHAAPAPAPALLPTPHGPDEPPLPPPPTASLTASDAGPTEYAPVENVARPGSPRSSIAGGSTSVAATLPPPPPPCATAAAGESHTATLPLVTPLRERLGSRARRSSGRTAPRGAAAPAAAAALWCCCSC